MYIHYIDNIMPPKGYISINITVEVVEIIDKIKDMEGFHSRDETVRYVIRWYYKDLHTQKR